jgi:hypothetical protein
MKAKDLVGARGKGRKDVKDSVRPVKQDFWEQFRVDFGWILHNLNIGNYVAVFEKTNELIFRVITFVNRNKSVGFVTDLVEELSEMLEPLLKDLKLGMYQSVELEMGHKIGLVDLKQQTIFPTQTGEFYIVCSGFNEPIPMEIYHSMKTIALNYAYKSLVEAHAIFHLIVSYTTSPSSMKKEEEKDREEEYYSLSPVFPEFWKQFSYEYSWLVYNTNIGMKHHIATKTYYLGSKIVEYQKLDSDFNSELDENEYDIDDEDETRKKIRELVVELPSLLKHLRKAMYSCISLADRDIGLMDLRQISLYPTPIGEFFVVCDGFSIAIPLETYTHMSKIVSEESMPIINKIHSVFHSLLMVERTIEPEDFPTGPELIIDDEDMFRNLDDEEDEDA